jgi:hypothetical protein
MLWALLPFVAAQNTPIEPPPECRQQCRQFNLSTCQQPRPNTDQEWTQAIDRLSRCVCPIVLRNQNTCGACLNRNAPDSSIYFSQLASKCNQNTATEELALLWDLKRSQTTATTTTTAAIRPTQAPQGSASTLSMGLVVLPFLFL